MKLKPENTAFYKEVFLQLLFPRVCPVCGKLLKLPAGWLREISDSKHPAALRRSGLLSGMICKNCSKKLLFTAEPRCVRCSRPLEHNDDVLCDLCAVSRYAFDSGSALLIHDEVSKKILYDLKFRNKRDNAELLGFEMALHFHSLPALWQAEVLLPVPLHKKRQKERGFNQAQLIAERFSFWLEKLYGFRLPVDSSYLLRAENTRPQRTLEAGMRAGNVRSAFQTSPGTGAGAFRSVPPYRSVILVDDIFTSGATISACAGCLKESGIRRVFFLTASIV